MRGLIFPFQKAILIAKKQNGAKKKTSKLLRIIAYDEDAAAVFALAVVNAEKLLHLPFADNCKAVVSPNDDADDVDEFKLVLYGNCLKCKAF